MPQLKRLCNNRNVIFYWLDARHILMKLIGYCKYCLSSDVTAVVNSRNETSLRKKNPKYKSYNLNGTDCKCLVIEILSYTFETRSLPISLVRTLQRAEFLCISKAFGYCWLTKFSLFILRRVRNL
jgi:hypothetical protein